MDINGTIRCWLEKSDGEWFFNVAEHGQEAPEVTGGVIELPQGGTRNSKAAVTGGVYTEGIEAPSDIIGNMEMKLNTVAPTEIEESFVSGSFGGAEQILTGLIRTEAADIGQAYSDNSDEAAAVNKAIASIIVRIESNITYEEIVEYVKEKTTSILGGILS